MNRKEPTSRVILKFVIAVIIAIYVLFPFALVVINSCKQTADITSNPIGLNGMSIGQLMKNMNDVVNNPNFLFWLARIWIFGADHGAVSGPAGPVRRHDGMGHLPEQDQVGDLDLFHFHCFHDHSLPGGHAAPDLHIPRCG